MIDLATLPKIKTLCNIDADNTTNDAVLRDIIASVSQKIENHLGRYIETTERTQYFDVRPGDYVFPVDAYPVSSYTAYNDADWVYSTAISGTYTHMDNSTGCLFVTDGVLVSGFKALKVVYTGGMATMTEELLDNYADLANAAERQVIFEYKTRGKIGVQSQSSGGGASISWQADGLLPEVKQSLLAYRNFKDM